MRVYVAMPCVFTCMRARACVGFSAGDYLMLHTVCLHDQMIVLSRVYPLYQRIKKNFFFKFSLYFIIKRRNFDII